MALVDYIDPSHKLTQGSTSKQCNPPTATGMGSALTLSFVASAANCYRSNRAASTFNYLHAGIGQTTIIVWAPTSVTGAQYIAGNQDGGSGAGWDWIRSADGALHRVFSASATVYSSAAGLIYSANVATFSGATYSVSAVPQYTTRNKSSIILSGAGSAPGTTDGVPFCIGGRNDIGVFADMRFRAAYGFRRVLTPAELTIVHAHIQAETGITP